MHVDTSFRGALIFLCFFFAVTESVKIGAILRRDTDAHLVEAFRLAVHWAQDNIFVWENIKNHKWTSEKLKLSYKIEYISSSNNADIEIARHVCSLAEWGAVAIFGPPDFKISRMISSFVDPLQLLFFDISWDGRSNGDKFNMFPESNKFLQAFEDLVWYWKWRRIIIIYEDDHNLLQIQKLLQSRKLEKQQLALLKIDNNNHIDVMHRVVKSDMTTIIVHVPTHRVRNVLQAALQVGAINFRFAYLITSLDLLSLDLEYFRHNHVRIIGFTLSNNKSAIQHNIIEKVRYTWNQQNRTKHPEGYFPWTDTALLIDGVIAFANGYLNASVLFPDGDDHIRARCDIFGEIVPYPVGSTLFNYLSHAVDQVEGLTGKISFINGYRSELALDINELNYYGAIDSIGAWNSDGNLMRMENISNVGFIENSTLRVTTIVERPYLFLRDESDQYPENEKYLGFCIDLLKRMAADLKFTYSIHVVKDGKYGNVQPNGTWNGMIGEILYGEADIAVAPLTVTYQRSQVVEFTKPFLSLGISVLFKIPQQQRPSLFSFMNPLGSATWLYIMIAATVMTFSTYIIAHVTPYEWRVQHLCNNRPDPEVSEHGPLYNKFSFSNTCWYIFSTLLKGCCEFHPGTVSTRLLGGIWWVFALVMISAYTANLAAVLTVDRRYLPIKFLDDLAGHPDISCGCVEGGSTMQFFNDSTSPKHRMIWEAMSKNPARSFAANNTDGVRRVLGGNYAFLMESTSLEYEITQNCNLTQIGGVLGSKGYGIALKKGSPWTEPISRWILNFSETGQTEQMKMNWWHKSSSCSLSSASSMKEERKSLNMENVAGLFVILLIGLCVAVVAAVIEFCVKNRENAELDRQSLWAEMVQELCFAVRMQKSTKRHNLHRRCSRCETATSLNTHVPFSAQDVGEPMENGHYPDSPCRMKQKTPAMVRFDVG